MGDLATLAQQGRIVAQVAGMCVLVIQVGTDIVAIPNRCPHGAYGLADAPLNDGALQCTAHHWRFDLHTGNVRTGWFDRSKAEKATHHLTFIPVEEEGGRLFVRPPVDLPPS